MSDVEPVTVVTAFSMSFFIMVLRFCFFALDSAVFTISMERAFSLSRRWATANLPTRSSEWAFMKVSIVLGFVILGFGMFSNITEI